MTPADAVHGEAVPVSKPGLPSFWPGLEQPAPPPLIVHENVAEPVAPVVSRAVTVELNVPAVVGVPVIRPVEALIDRPVGRPVADQVNDWPACESVAVICSVLAVPTVPVWLPGLFTVTVLVPPPPVQVGSAAWAGTDTAFHAAFVVLYRAQVGSRFFAAVSVHVRYFRYDDVVVFISIALYMICSAFWMPTPVTDVPLQVGLVGWPLVGLVPSASR